MPEVQEVFRLATQKARPDPGFVGRQYEHRRKQDRNRKIGAFAVAAVIAVVAALVVMSNLDAGDAREGAKPADPGPTVTSSATKPEQLAIDFLQGFGSLDADKVMTYLADDADITGLVSSTGASGTSGTQEELRLLISLLDAQGYSQGLPRCEETGSSSAGTTVRCPFSFQLLGAQEFGLGRFLGSYFDITVRDGKVVRSSLFWETERFSPQVWEPFASWVSEAHPDDASVMYQDGTYSGTRLTEESIRLWEQRLRDYIGAFTPAGDPFPVGRVSLVVDGVPFSFRMPRTIGWERFGDISINKSIVGAQGAEAIVFWTGFPDGVNADPCPGTLGSSVGPTIADAAGSVATAPGTVLVTGPSDVTVGGYPAKYVVLTVREDLGCDPGYFYTWPDMHWGALWPTTTVGDTIHVWIIEVGGSRLFIEAEMKPLVPAAPGTDDQRTNLEQEIQQIVQSIQFG